MAIVSLGPRPDFRFLLSTHALSDRFRDSVLCEIPDEIDKIFCDRWKATAIEIEEKSTFSERLVDWRNMENKKTRGL